MDDKDGSFEDSITVFEVYAKVCYNKEEATSLLRRAWGSMTGKIFKVTMMPRKQGFRVWVDGKFSECWHPFLVEQVGQAGAEDCRVRMISADEIAILRQKDDKFHAISKRLEDEVASAGLRVADNLAAMLRKRKNQDSAKTQRRVSHVVDLVSSVNSVVGQKVRVGGRRLSEHLDSLHQDDDDGQAEAEDG
jgi:hypothetical protein